jgi:hypothetical protein
LLSVIGEEEVSPIETVKLKQFQKVKKKDLKSDREKFTKGCNIYSSENSISNS